MKFDDLKAFVKFLEQERELIRIDEIVDPKYEISAILKENDRQRGPALLFENVKGYNIPVICNVIGSRKRLCMVMGTTEEELVQEFIKRRNKGIPSKIVDKGDERGFVDKKDIDVLKILPILTYHEKDSNPYITGGVVFLKDPVTNMKSMGVHRIQVKNKDKLTISLLPGKMGRKILEDVEGRGEHLDVAIAIGLHPLILLVSTIITTSDKLEIAGGLREKAVKLIKCKTVDIEVPDESEIIIEGKFLPKIRDIDGPFGEPTGYYITLESPVMEVTAISLKKDAVYQAIGPGSREEHLVTILLSMSVQCLEDLRKFIPSVKAVSFSPGTLFSHLIISIEKKNEGEAKRVLTLALSMFPYVKNAVVVDDEIDVNDPREVEWAISSRCQGDKDMVIISGLTGSPINPSVKGGVTSKIGIDATKPLWDLKRFEKIKVPDKYRERAREIVKKWIY